MINISKPSDLKPFLVIMLSSFCFSSFSASHLTKVTTTKKNKKLTQVHYLKDENKKEKSDETRASGESGESEESGENEASGASAESGESGDSGISKRDEVPKEKGQ